MKNKKNSNNPISSNIISIKEGCKKIGISEEKYREICTDIWGCSPLDVFWAIEKPVFREAYSKKYPNYEF